MRSPGFTTRLYGARGRWRLRALLAGLIGTHGRELLASCASRDLKCESESRAHDPQLRAAIFSRARTLARLFRSIVFGAVSFVFVLLNSRFASPYPCPSVRIKIPVQEDKLKTCDWRGP